MSWITNIIYNTNKTYIPWTSITSDITGTSVAACSSDGKIYTFTGDSWTINSAGIKKDENLETNILFVGITSNIEMKILAACTTNDAIYVSVDYGINWNSKSTPTKSWTSISMNETGTTIVACSSDGAIYKSVDTGESWNTITNPSESVNDNWSCIKISKTTNHLVLSENGGRLYTSSDLGITWEYGSITNGSNKLIYENWQFVSGNDNHTILIAGLKNERIYISKDSGVTWVPTETATYEWTSLTSNGNGRVLAAGTINGDFIISSDYGYSWVTFSYSTPVYTCSTLIGNKLFLSVDNANIWYFENTSIQADTSIVVLEPSHVSYIFGETMNILWTGLNPPYNLYLKNINDFSITEIATNITNTNYSWVVSAPISGNYVIRFTDNKASSVNSNSFLILRFQDICFVKDTIVNTDQGDVAIQNLIPGKHTIFKESIIEITVSVHIDSHLVYIKAFAFGSYPTKDTMVSREHKINGPNSFREAKEYVNGTTVRLIPYHREPLYNVLLIKPGFMKVHGMMVETLDPYCNFSLKNKSKRTLILA